MTCVTRLRMKLRKTREVYWLEASVSASRVMENVMPITDIIEPASVALYSLERGGIRPGQRIAILGVGSIGLFTVQWARAKEAGHIIATDVVDERLQAAKSMGAHTTLNPTQTDSRPF